MGGLVQSRIARFQVLRELGAGGVGIVFEALDSRLGVRVALKMLRRVSPEGLLRLKGEFRELQDLHHPNLVNFGELIEESGNWYLTMELVDGLDFVSYVRPHVLARDHGGHAVGATGPTAQTLTGAPPTDMPRTPSVHTGALDEGRLRGALGQLAQGLNALHAAHKIHRDIKPSNVRVTLDGRVVILDFGLVTDITRDGQSAETDFAGTIDYMAPEQAACQRIGPEADWYAVGVMLYEALAGRMPFEGTPMRVMILKQEREPPPVAAIVPDAPADLCALCADLLRLDTDQRPTGPSILERLGAGTGLMPEPTVPPASQPPRPLFVGRDLELRVLDHAFRESRRSAVAVLVEGESGVGKTALARRYIERLAADEPAAVVLWGRCYERESLPYKGFDGVIDALSRHLARLPPAQAAGLLPPHPGLLGHVFPVLRRVEAIAEAPAGDAADTLEPQEQRMRLFAGVRGVLARLGALHPVIIAVDDLQWADADSRAILNEILRPPDAPAVLLLATVRTGGRGGEPAGGGALLAGDVRLLVLERLGPDEAQCLAAALLEQAPDAARGRATAIAAEAEGHPLFIHELVRHARAHGGQASLTRLDQALWGRIGGLPPVARDVLELVALAGVPLPVAALTTAAGVDPAAVQRAVSLLRVDHLVRLAPAHDAEGLEPYHDRVRDAVLGYLGEAQRREHHRRLALALEASGAEPQILAAHWAGSGETETAARYAIRAAEAAEAALAFDVAARLYRSALERLPPRRPGVRELRVRTADALANAGRGAEAAETYLAALEGAAAVEALELRRRAAQQYLRCGHIDEGLELSRRVLKAVGLKLARTPTVALIQLLLRRARLRLRGAGFRERTPAEIPKADLVRLDVSFSVAESLATVDTVYAMALQERVLLLALRAGDPARLAAACGICACNRAAEGERARRHTERLWHATRDLARRTDDPMATAWCDIAEFFMAYYLGEWRRTAEVAARAETFMRERCRGALFEIASARLWRVWSLYYLGDLVELERCVSLYLSEAVDRGDLYAATNFRTGPASVAWLMRDDPDGLLEEARAAVGQWSHARYHVQHWLAFGTEMMAALYRSDAAAADATLATGWRPLRGSLLMRVQAVRVEAITFRARAALLAAATPGPESARRLAGAERDAERIARERQPWCTPIADLLRAGVAARRGQPEAASALVERATADFEGADMQLYAAAARYRHGQLRGGRAGDALLRDAQQWLRVHRVHHGPRLVAMLAPGFVD